MTKGDVIAELRKAVEAAGSKAKWAEKAGVSQQYVGDVLSGRRDPGEGILKALWLERVVTYRRKKR